MCPCSSGVICLPKEINKTKLNKRGGADLLVVAKREGRIKRWASFLLLRSGVEASNSRAKDLWECQNTLTRRLRNNLARPPFKAGNNEVLP